MGRYDAFIHKREKDKKDKYRPVNILPILSKYFEKCMVSQISSYFEEIFSEY